MDPDSPSFLAPHHLGTSMVCAFAARARVDGVTSQCCVAVQEGHLDVSANLGPACRRHWSV